MNWLYRVKQIILSLILVIVTLVSFAPPTHACRWPWCSRPNDAPLAGARGPCQEDRSSLLPLVSREVYASLTPVTPKAAPLTEAETLTPLEQRWGRTPGLVTAREHPTFWFYIPQPPSGWSNAEFVLLDRDRNQVVEPIPINLYDTPGIIEFKLDRVSLKVNQPYQWFLSIPCNPRHRSQNPTLSGWIERIELSPQLAQKIEQAPLQQKIELYFNEGLWYEGVTLTLQHLRDRPQDTEFRQEWQELLTIAGLDTLQDRPISQCCSR